MLNKIKMQYAYRVLEQSVNSYLVKYKVSKQLEDSGDIIMLSANMTINEKNETGDPAIWYEWMEAIDGKKTPLVINKSFSKEYGIIEFYEAVYGEREKALPNKMLTIKESYDAAIRFLTKYAERLESKDIKDFVNHLTFEKWEEAIKVELKKQ